MATRLVGAPAGLLGGLPHHVLPHVQPNWWIGIRRTIWTLSSETVWCRTHQGVGQTGVLTRLVLLFANIALFTSWVGFITGAVIAVWTVGLVGASC
ncbi:hypothetical protein TPY_2091 [Sulfobacillus acidophilus TPY]|nr:hypothetical protein TPY_2091 [Sulfobacillus acidophilus TPY]